MFFMENLIRCYKMDEAINCVLERTESLKWLK